MSKVKLNQEESLAQSKAEQVQECLASKGWQEVLLPFLQAKRDQSFPDPANFIKDEEFNYAAKTTSIYKKVIQELLIEIDKYKQAATYLQAKQNGELSDPFGIGREGGA
jgi:hypothetical protein